MNYLYNKIWTDSVIDSENFVTINYYYFITGTFAIQSIIPIDIIGPVIEIVCNFYTNTDAVGCLIQLILITDNTVQYNSSNNRTGDQAVVTLSGIIMGYYQLIVLEIESDQSLVTVPIEEVLTLMDEPDEEISLIPTSMGITSDVLTFSDVISESGKNYYKQYQHENYNYYQHFKLT